MEKRKKAHAVRKALARDLDKSPKISAFRTFLTYKTGMANEIGITYDCQGSSN